MMQMNSVALKRSLGAEAPPCTALQVLVDVVGPDSTSQQHATDYFCYAQLASQASLPLLLFLRKSSMTFLMY